MPRVRGRLDPAGRDPTFDLLMGPTDAPGEYTVEELGVLWERHGPEIMAGRHGRHDGTRPWAWWVFEAGEEQPGPVWNSETCQWEGEGDETVRLVELGELTDAELAALREQANEARLCMALGPSGSRADGATWQARCWWTQRRWICGRGSRRP
jgi:hypothetical protein